MLFSSSIAVSAFDFEFVNKIEDLTEKRVRSLVNKIDPQAIVLVNFQFKEEALDGTLPGTYLDVSIFQQRFATNNVFPHLIKSLEISIYWSGERSENWVDEKLKSLFNLKDNQVTIRHEKMDSETLGVILENNKNKNVLFFFEQLQSHLNALKEQWVFPVSLAFFGLILLSFIVFTFVSLKGQHSLQKEMQALTVAISTQSGEETRGFQGDSLKNSQPANPENSGASSAESTIQLSAEQSLALLSDCYWCELDEYAIYIWKFLHTTTREQIMSLWPTTEQYLRAISHIEPKNLGYEHHPAYLRPLRLENVSQQDLVEWLTKQPQAWSLLSPLRQIHLPIGLAERMKFMKASPLTVDQIKLPEIISKPRVLSGLRLQLNLTQNDELYLLSNHHLISLEERRNFQTLLWFSKRDLEYKKSILSPISARDLATAWIGPEEILNEIAQAIPEKKRKLLDEYRQNIKANRMSPVFQYLLQKGLEEEKDVA